VNHFKAHRTYKRSSSLPNLSKLVKITTKKNTPRRRIMASNYWVKTHSVEIIKKLEQTNKINLTAQMLNIFNNELILCENILTKNIKDFKTKGSYNLKNLVVTKNFVNQVTHEINNNL